MLLLHCRTECITLPRCRSLSHTLPSVTVWPAICSTRRNVTALVAQWTVKTSIELLPSCAGRGELSRTLGYSCRLTIKWTSPVLVPGAGLNVKISVEKARTGFTELARFSAESLSYHPSVDQNKGVCLHYASVELSTSYVDAWYNIQSSYTIVSRGVFNGCRYV